MILRRLLTTLVFALPILIVSFGVVMAAQALAAALGDPLATSVLLSIGLACLVLIVVDLILLVGTLGIKALEDRPPHGDSDSETVG